MAQNHGMRLPNGQRPYSGKEPYIFISYAHRDNERMLPIISRMLEDGYRVWYDEGIDPGTEWDATIAEHIGGCAYFIAFLSENYLASDNCKDELSFVRDLGKPRLLVYLTDVKLPMGMQMRLGRLQAIHKYTYSNAQDFYDKLYTADGLDVCAGQKKAAQSVSQNTYEAPKKPVQQVIVCTSEEEPLCCAAAEAGVEEGTPEAVNWYRKLAEQGNAEAQKKLGDCYYYGEGVAEDKPEAVRWYRKGAEQGNAAAQNELGFCYFNGEGVVLDYAEGARWYRKAAEQGNAEAQYSLGRCYYFGAGVARDAAESVRWFRKAAEQGNVAAEVTLKNLGY